MWVQCSNEPLFFYYLFHNFFLVPHDAPSNVKVMQSTSSSVLVSWSAPTIPNGIIAGYTLYVNKSDDSPFVTIPLNFASTNYTIVGLYAYQLIFVRVSAKTVAGEGPLSEYANGRSREEGNHIMHYLVIFNMSIYFTLHFRPFSSISHHF